MLRVIYKCPIFWCNARNYIFIYEYIPSTLWFKSGITKIWHLNGSYYFCFSYIWYKMLSSSLNVVLSKTTSPWPLQSCLSDILGTICVSFSILFFRFTHLTLTISPPFTRYRPGLVKKDLQSLSVLSSHALLKSKVFEYRQLLRQMVWIEVHTKDLKRVLYWRCSNGGYCACGEDKITYLSLSVSINDLYIIYHYLSLLVTLFF